MTYAIAAGYFLICFVASGVARLRGGRGGGHNYYLVGFFIGLMGILVTAIVEHLGGL